MLSDKSAKRIAVPTNLVRVASFFLENQEIQKCSGQKCKSQEIV